jgi:hypothetical protein
VYGVFEEVLWEQFGVYPFCFDMVRWFLVKWVVAIEAEVILFSDILFSYFSSLLRREGCVING